MNSPRTTAFVIDEKDHIRIKAFKKRGIGIRDLILWAMDHYRFGGMSDLDRRRLDLELDINELERALVQNDLDHAGERDRIEADLRGKRDEKQALDREAGVVA